MSQIRMWKPRKIELKPLVSVTVASYLNEDPRRADSLLCLLYSLKAQTYQNFEVVVMHDGPVSGIDKDKLTRSLEVMGPGFRFEETGERRGKFGHPWRSAGFRKTLGTYLCTTNDDNYYAPSFLEAMLYELVSKKADLAYCDMVHSHRQWKPMSTKMQRGSIDLGCWMATRSLVLKSEWTDFGFAGDWTFIHTLERSAGKVVKVPMTLFVHN